MKEVLFLKGASFPCNPSLRSRQFDGNFCYFGDCIRILNEFFLP
jgi:hypothetical protein